MSIKKTAQTVQFSLPGFSSGLVPSEPYIGIDEAGRGCLAGPVVSAAVWLPQGALSETLSNLTDSKLLKAEERTALVPLIKKEAIAFGLGLSWQQEVDAYNVLKATHISMLRAIIALKINFDKKNKAKTAGLESLPLLLVDGNRRIPDALFMDKAFLGNQTCKYPPRQRTLVKGDLLASSISAASVLAKTFRDDLMEAYELRYPNYGFYFHKGYATQAHRDAILKYGACRLHRKSFAGVR
ncbi:ribonuclease HII [Desulfovibrio litoralis]|uniref:Ribonuclease n=1 Tax=Desulfovibrio litoralis DSM 11393 TaxID=1121455 RepID=A0A1M7TEE8_9BACT|nr:ribonuclease HII [Desulfovibrio litoralis]SHN69119.1 RNase HII [Desulfovibrio litoralis DSM 11393]